jgi:hypothetical protein
MTIKADYGVQVEELGRSGDTIEVTSEVNVAELIATIIQDATYHECQIMEVMLGKRQRILVRAEKAATAFVALMNGEPAFNTEGCKTGRTACGPTSDEKAMSCGVAEYIAGPFSTEPVDEPGPGNYPMSVANMTNIELAT